MKEDDDENDGRDEEAEVSETEVEEEETAAHHALVRQTIASQLLLIGSVMAISGLMLSLLLLIFRTQCDLDSNMGMYVNTSGAMQMCKNDYKPFKLKPSARSDFPHEVVVDVPGAICHNDSACVGYPHGFCGGGPPPKGYRSVNQELRVPNYCGSESASCTCKTAIGNCGTSASFEWEFTPNDVMLGCTGDACSTVRTITIPWWTQIRGFSGCTFRRKCRKHDVMIWTMNDLEEDGLFFPMNDHATKFDEVALELAQVPDVKSGFFWPSTISESVAKAGSAANKIFFGFMLCASLCLMASNYTVEVKTVDLPGMVIPFVGVSFNTMRSWLPPIGLILLSCVPMVPESKILTLPDALLTIVHLCGAQFCFVIYLVCEGAALMDKRNVAEMEEQNAAEWYVRFSIFLIGSIAMLTFVVTWASLFLFSGSESTPYLSSAFHGWGGYSDFYKDSHSSGFHLLRPAEGAWLDLKIVSYSAEFIVSLSILSSQYVIWFYFQQPFNKFKTRVLRMAHGESDE